MITASEPLEFIPRGRQAVENHPGPLVSSQKTSSNLSENILLRRLQNVNITHDDTTEFWIIHEQKTNLTGKNPEQNVYPNFNYNFSVHDETELYFKGNIAVWYKGMQTRSILSDNGTCFSCETPIKHGFFCSTDFIKTTLPEKSSTSSSQDANQSKSVSREVCICLIDSTCLKVFSDDCEDYTTTLDFPVSNVWPTKFGLIFEKEPLSTIIENHSINFPRVFSLLHPLEEIRPILLKHNTNDKQINYFTEADYKIIFTTWDNDLILLYDQKNCIHFICILRKATENEIEFVNQYNEMTTNFSGTPSRIYSDFQSNSMKFSSGIGKCQQSTFGRISSMGSTPNITAHSLNRSGSLSHLGLLQTTLGVHTTAQDLRKLGEPAPSKPIVPDLCLETIWTESRTFKKYCKNSTNGFLHTDFIGQHYVCFIQPRSSELNLVQYDRRDGIYIFGDVLTISAKDAVSLPQLNLIAVLGTCGTLILYSGCSVVGKVHIGGILSTLATSSNLSNSFSTSSLPRRSSLLPTLSVTPETKFDEDLHTLSPVQPIQTGNYGNKTNQCLGLRDPCGNRLTIIYPKGKLFRFSLPLISENILVTNCLTTIKTVLDNNLALNVIIKWYGVRNAPGTQDLSPHKEWGIFTSFLLELMGSTVKNRDLILSQSPTSSSLDEPKKRRINENSEGTDTDFDLLMQFMNHETNSNENQDNAKAGNDYALKNDMNTILFHKIPMILYAFHLMYEDMKLDLTVKSYLEPLANFLYRISLLLKLDHYALHYFIDHPQLIKIESRNIIEDSTIGKFQFRKIFHSKVPSIFHFIYQLIEDNGEKYPIILNVNTKSSNIIEIFKTIYMHSKKLNNLIEIEDFRKKSNEYSSMNWNFHEEENEINLNSLKEDIMNCLLKLKITRDYLENLPISMFAIISNILDEIRMDAPIGLPAEGYELLLRPELVAHAHIHEKITKEQNDIQNPVDIQNPKEHSLSPRIPTIPDVTAKADIVTDEDGMEHMDTKLLRLRFPTDLRINDVRNFLNSSSAIIVDMHQQPNVSDHEFIEEQEKYLYAMSIRTMALPLGRGMFTLRTNTPTVTESLTIPKLCLAGKDATKGSTIEIQQIEVPPNMNTWPLFHNGVAAGLRITPDSKDIDSTWIVYNKPKGIVEISTTEHAGFLMALGLNGHLKSLSYMSIYEYLVTCEEMTSLGLLLGISAAHRGSMDLTTTKLLSIHIEALLPPTALELDIPQNIQIASIMGIGLLYQGSAKRHIAEVLLQEIGRPPGPEMENSVERESYSLTTGLALGLVTLGLGESAPGLRDLQLTDTLHYYMIGGNKRLLTGSQKDKYKLSSFQIREGNAVNIDVTAPGSILALGLMYFNTNNEAVANWMKPPDTRYLLDFVRPDLLLLRMIAKGIIMWDSIQPSQDWIINQFPKSLSFDIQRGPSGDNNNIDHEAICQAYCNVITGAAFCVGLRFAGTENNFAYETLESIIEMFLNAHTQYLGKFAGNATIESCLVTVLLSLSLVYAGTGNLNIIRIIRMLRSRIGPSQYSVTYGSHMALHMALGFLFLGAGRFTLSRSPESIASLICALFPKFPTHSNDNRYHLQAFRHLYVLAIEPRLLIPRDIDSGKLCLCRVSYVSMKSNQLIALRNAPCMLPELKTIKAIYIDDPYFWKIGFVRGRNWDQLLKILEKCECIDLKQIAGSFSTIDDPKKTKQYLTQAIKINQLNYWKVNLNNILSFSNDTIVMNLINNFFLNSNKKLESQKIMNDIRMDCNGSDGAAYETTENLSGDDNLNKKLSEIEIQQKLMIQANNCLINDKMHEFAVGIGLAMIWNNLKKSPNSNDAWQLKIISKYLKHKLPENLLQKNENFQTTNNNNNQSNIKNSLWNEILQSNLINLEILIDNWTTKNLNLLKKLFFSKNSNLFYLKNEKFLNLMKLTVILSFYNFPMNLLKESLLSEIEYNDYQRNHNFLKFILQIKQLYNLDTLAVRCLWKILNSN